MIEFFKKIFLFDVFPFLCRLIASILLLLALYGVGFPPKESIGTTSASLFVLSLFFFLLPMAKKISLGKLLTFEKEIKKVKDEVTDFKVETRESLKVYSNMITAISNTVSQTVNVHLPGKAEVAEVKDELNSTLNQQNTSSHVEDEITTYINESSNDLNFALAKLRMELEKSLRELLDKRTTTDDPNAMRGKFLSARSLFKEFTNQYPKYRGMHGSFDYILKVCNAAIHGQKIDEGYGYEAIGMGITMLKEFESISK